MTASHPPAVEGTMDLTTAITITITINIPVDVERRVAALGLRTDNHSGTDNHSAAPSSALRGRGAGTLHAVIDIKVPF